MENNKPYRRGKIRFLALFLASMLMFGNQYAFNNPQALQESFEQILDISEPQFNLLYTIFAFPNIFTTLIIGVLIDFLGVRIGVISLSLGVALAQIIVAFGGAYQSYTTLLIGRMVFGIASQSLITAQASITSFWFKGKQLATALGIILTFPQVGNALNSYLTPEVFEATNSLGPPLFLSVGFCFISFICGIILVLLDMRADKIDRQNPHLLNKYGETQQSGEHVKCSDIKQLPGTFWIVLILCMFAMSLYVPFMDNANRLYQKRFCFSQVGAGKALMLTYLICPIVSPFLGMAVDKFGKRRFFMVLTSITYLFAQFLILVYPSCLDTIEVGSITGLIFIGIFLNYIGIGYALYSNCLVPVIPIIVKHSITGTAFGLMAMIQSIALSTFPLISSNLVNAQEDPQIGFRYSSIFFTTMAALGLITSLSLYMIDKKLGKKLDAIDYQQIPFTEEFTESDKTGNISQILTPIKNTSSVDLQQSLLNKNVQQNFKQISKEQKAKYDFDL